MERERPGLIVRTPEGNRTVSDPAALRRVVAEFRRWIRWRRSSKGGQT